MFQINSIILWSRKNRTPRLINLELNSASIITGRSGTGKSAILNIIDYCLGSSKCNVPVGLIRDETTWFSVVIAYGSQRIRISRKNPEEKRASGQFEWRNIFTDDEKLQMPIANSNLVAIKAQLDNLVGIPNLPIETNKFTKNETARASFRDTISFNFQPQHIVASPNVMFYRNDTSEYRKRCIDTFPILLNVVNEDILLLVHEKADLESKARRLKYEIDIQKNAFASWKAESESLIGQAMELNLIDRDLKLPENLNEQLVLLSTVPEKALKAVQSQVLGTTEYAAKHVKDLRASEEAQSDLLFSLKLKLDKLNKIRDIGTDYSNDLTNYRKRANGLSWFTENISQSAECPICKSEDDGARAILKDVEYAYNALNTKIDSLEGTNVAVAKETHLAKTMIAQAEEKLDAIRGQLASALSKDVKYSTRDIYRFSGKIENIIANISRSYRGTDKERELEQIQIRLSIIKERLREFGAGQKFQNAVDEISYNIKTYAMFLELESSDRDIHLDMRSELNLSFLYDSEDEDSDRKKSDMLSEIGSGSNWMGYHLCTYFGIHKYFFDRNIPHLARFIVIDQPSQVYFPADTYEQASVADARGSELNLARMIFQLVDRFMQDTEGRVQVILLEHADGKVYGKSAQFSPTHLIEIENWHENNSDWLIPKDWQEAI